MKKRQFVAVTMGVMVLSVGLMLMSTNQGVQASAPASKTGNPFQAILDKLDQIQAAIPGGGGGQDGNHTLRWDTVKPAATRFVVLSEFANAAVRDNETGLVWELSPASTLYTWNIDPTTGNSA